MPMLMLFWCLVVVAERTLALSKGFGASTTPKRQFKVDDGEPYSSMMSWLESQGASVSGVAVALFEPLGLRGLVATRDVAKGSVVCSLPSPLALALEDPENAESVEDKEMSMVTGGANLLGWYMIADEWAPYVATLPKRDAAQFSPTPDMWSDEALDMAEFPPLKEYAEKRRSLVGQVAEERGIDVEELRFSTWLASSRAFGLKMSSGQITKTIRVLCPLLDLLNWSPDPNAELVVKDADKDDATFAICARRNIQKGTQVHLAYAGMGSTAVDLVSDYGFVPSAATGADSRLVLNTMQIHPDLLSTPRKETLEQLTKIEDEAPDKTLALKLRALLKQQKDKLPTQRTTRTIPKYLTD